MINLEPDQTELVNATREAMRFNKSVLMQGVPGSGKTYMASYILQSARAKGKRTLFTVPRKQLLLQTSNSFRNLDIPHSFIASDRSLEFNPHSSSHIATVGTLYNRLSSLEPPDIAIIDECHYGAKQLEVIIDWLKKSGAYIIGLSGTPWKLSGQGLGCYFDYMVEGPSVRWLIDNKRLADYRLFAPSSPDLSGISIRGGDYAKEQLASKMELDNVLIGDAVEHYKQHASGKLNIVYCVSIKHSEITAQAFRAAGVSAIHMDGRTPDRERTRIINAFADHKVEVLCTVDLAIFGFDLASQVGRDVTVECMSDLAPTKSLSKQIQKWFRTLRYKDEPALIFDHANNVRNPLFGLPCEDRLWTLQDRSKGTGGSQERTFPVTQCLGEGGCFYCHPPAPCCPNCGRVYEIQERKIKQIEGELSEVEIKKVKLEKKKKLWKAKTKDDLKAIAIENGYKPGWVRIQMKLRNINK